MTYDQLLQSVAAMALGVGPRRDHETFKLGWQTIQGTSSPGGGSLPHAQTRYDR